jgi:hypothetical protein
MHVGNDHYLMKCSYISIKSLSCDAVSDGK